MKLSTQKNILLQISLLMLLVQCSTDTQTGNSNDSNNLWSVNIEEVVDGGPGVDGIPSLDTPKFESISESSLADNMPVIAIRIGDEVKVYPVFILDWHEMVNDVVGDIPICISYCPLTATEIAWNRTIDGEVATFGVSGLLYRNNLIPYDRKTKTRYSQMLMKGIHGEKKDEFLDIIPSVRTYMGTIRAYYPDAVVLTTQTGYFRNYSSYPYGNYRSDHSYIIFPVKNKPLKDKGLKAKDFVFGVLDQENKPLYYPFRDDSNPIRSITEATLFVYLNSTDNLSVAFNTIEKPLFQLTDELPFIARDTANVKYDIFGYSEDGIQLLKTECSMRAYFFAWFDMYPNTREN